MVKIDIFTASICYSKENPRKVGSWAAIVKVDNDEIQSLSGSDTNTNCIRMQLTAFIQALLKIKSEVKSDAHVSIYTQNEYIYNTFKYNNYWKWQDNGWVTALDKPVKNQDLLESLIELVEELDVEFIKLEPDSRDILGNKAQFLARKALRSKLNSKSKIYPKSQDEIRF